MEIIPGVHWLKAGYANVYLCVEDSGLTLVDSGTPGQADKILAYVHSLGREPSELKHILITHADWDHAGSAAELQARTEATVVAAPPTAEFLRRGRAPKHMPRAFNLVLDLFFGRYEPITAEALVPAVAGTVLPVFEELHILAAPGHTLDHHAFYSPRRGVLFAGDALRTRGGKVNMPSAFIAADMAAARKSTLRLLRLAPAVIACGHGRPVYGHDHDALLALKRELQHV